MLRGHTFHTSSFRHKSSFMYHVVGIMSINYCRVIPAQFNYDNGNLAPRKQGPSQLSTKPGALSLSEGKPANKKETNRLPTTWPLPNIVCLIVVTRFQCHAIWLMWQCRYSRVRLVVADGLLPIWRQGIFNNRDDVAQPSFIYQNCPTWCLARGGIVLKLSYQPIIY